MERVSRAALLVVALACAPRAVLAQESSRELFDAGIAALEAGRAAEGRDYLRRAIELDRNVPTCFNLGVALRRTGEPLDALALFDELDTGGCGELTDAHRERIAEQRRLAAADVSHLRIRVEGSRGAEVFVDGVRVAEVSSAEPLFLPSNSGRHRVEAREPSGARTSASIAVPVGGEASVVLRFAEHPGRAAARTRPRSREPEEGGIGAGWIVLGASALAVLVAGGVVFALVYEPGTREPPAPAYEALSRW